MKVGAWCLSSSTTLVAWVCRAKLSLARHPLGRRAKLTIFHEIRFDLFYFWLLRISEVGKRIPIPALKKMNPNPNPKSFQLSFDLKLIFFTRNNFLILLMILSHCLRKWITSLLFRKLNKFEPVKGHKMALEDKEPLFKIQKNHL